jgi:hypothetical protein
MATLVEVFAELFRAFGYTPSLNVELEGTTGRRHPITLLLEKDSRRLAVATWIHRQSLGPAFVRELIDAVKDTGCDGGLVASLGATPETLVVEAGQAGVAVWDSRRIAQELGNAVLRETCPDVWEQPDPWTAPRPSRILEQVRQAVLEAPPPAAVTEPVAAPAPPVAEAPPPAPEPAPASPALAAPETLQVPMAFGLLDQATAAPAPAPTPAPEPAASIVPPGRNTLRLQVAPPLATSLAKGKTRTVDRLLLRLVPHYVFDYEASLLIEGSLQSEKRTGRMAVDAATKRVREWALPLEVADVAVHGVDVDEKPVRLAEPDARKLLASELRTLVTRDVVLEEDDSEWSVVVKKKVELAENELRLTLQGVYYLPVWRASGRDGSVEIDATNGQFVHEELTVAKSDALLI